MALIRPPDQVPRRRSTAVAARDPRRAAIFARKHGIPRVADSYAALLADPEIDAIYNSACRTACTRAGRIRRSRPARHVLCEKPLAANADEARTMAEAATRCNRVLVEAFHYRYHPLAPRIARIIDSGALGTGAPHRGDDVHPAADPR
jgi:predicted dehydrogenase